MVKKVLSVFICIMMLGGASLALAGGPVPACAPTCAPPCAPPCGPNAGGPYGPGSQYWGDAPFPGLCGGVVALPFLVVGSLLGGNTAGPGGPGYNCAPPRYNCAPPRYNCAPPPCAPVSTCAPPMACGPAYGPGAYGGGGGGLFGLPCLDLCSNILGSLGGGSGFLY